MTDLHYNFKADEIHVHHDECDSVSPSDFNVSFNYFLAGELSTLNRKSSDSMTSSMSRFLLNLKKKKIIKGGERSDEKGKKKKPKPDQKPVIPDVQSPEMSSTSTQSIEIFVASADGLLLDISLMSNLSWASDMIVVVGVGRPSGKIALCNSVGVHVEKFFANVVLKLKVVLNPPRILSTKTFPNKIINMSPVVCIAATNSAYIPWYLPDGTRPLSDQLECDYAWYMSRSEPHSVVDGDYVYTGCSTAVFVPNVARDGTVYRLKVYCTPKIKISGGYVYGRSVTHYIHTVVQSTPLHDDLPAGTGLRPMTDSVMVGAEEHSRTPTLAQGNCLLRIMSYNILSDCYCGKMFCNGRYDYLADEYIDPNYRCQLVYREIVEVYKCPDIVALQEVDAKVFHQYLRPLLDLPDGTVGTAITDIVPSQNYHYTHYTNKTGSTNEGCALLINSKVFELLAFVDLDLSKCIEGLPEVVSLLLTRPDVRDILVNRVTTIAQIAVCLRKSSSCSSDRIVITANTHLFFHPVAEYVRLLQMHAITSHVQRIKDQLLSGTFTCEKGTEGVAVHLSTFAQSAYKFNKDATAVTCVYTGDFNSTSETPTVEFILKYVNDVRLLLLILLLSNSNYCFVLLCRGEILADHTAWNSLHDFSWGRGGAVATGSNSGSNSPLPDAACGVARQGSSQSSKAKNYVNPADHSQYHKLQVAQMVRDIDISECIPASLDHRHGNSCSVGSVSGHNNGWDARIDPTVSHSGDGLISAQGFPLFTNYTVDFKDCLDYIFLEQSLCSVVQRNALPSAAELYLEPDPHGGADSRVHSIPSQHHPSDHLPVVVDVVML